VRTRLPSAGERRWLLASHLGVTTRCATAGRWHWLVFVLRIRTVSRVDNVQKQEISGTIARVRAGFSAGDATDVDSISSWVS